MISRQFTFRNVACFAGAVKRRKVVWFALSDVRYLLSGRYQSWPTFSTILCSFFHIKTRV